MSIPPVHTLRKLILSFEFTSNFGFILSRIMSTNLLPKRSYFGAAKPSQNADFVIDLRSDTVTKPSAAMRQQIANAEVGDDVMEEDYTVKELESRMAGLLGKEAGIFVPSGTMGNLLALLVHCNNRGSEVIVGDKSHMFKYEQGGMSQFGGIMANKLPNEPNGTFAIELLKENIREEDDHCPSTSLICIENTHNLCGGRILPLEWIDQVTEIGRLHGIPVHMDGARLFSASVATGIPASRLVRDVASVNICLSKNLGTPMGSVLAGTTDFIKKSRRLRRAIGGGMRQIGMMAAAGLYALDHNIDRLEEDHKNAKFMTTAIAALKNPVFTVDLEQVETNMIVVHLKHGNADEVCKRFSETPKEEIKALGAGICVLSHSRNEKSIRLVLHCDATGDLVDKATLKICYVATELLRTQN